jgi:hypothetical protein
MLTPVAGNPAPTLTEARQGGEAVNPSNYSSFSYKAGTAGRTRSRPIRDTLRASGTAVLRPYGTCVLVEQPEWLVLATIGAMLRRLPVVEIAMLMALTLLAVSVPAQQAPAASGARILLLPRKIVSGDRATLAVLDMNGRLTPGVGVVFSNGDHLTTDATGRAMFVAPLNPGMISANISGRSGKIYTTILNPADAASSGIEISAAPRVASLSDRFELSGRGFCGDADANHVTVDGKAALVLASSPTTLVVLPPADLDAGESLVELGCAKRDAQPFTVRFVALSLEADSSPLTPGDHRTLTVRVRGTTSKISLEARNLAPEIAELSGGNPARVSSSGGADNDAKFELVGRQRGNFVVSIHMLPTQSAPKR